MLVVKGQSIPDTILSLRKNFDEVEEEEEEEAPREKTSFLVSFEILNKQTHSVCVQWNERRLVVGTYKHVSWKIPPPKKSKKSQESWKSDDACEATTIPPFTSLNFTSLHFTSTSPLRGEEIGLYPFSSMNGVPEILSAQLRGPTFINCQVCTHSSVLFSPLPPFLICKLLKKKTRETKQVRFLQMEPKLSNLL